MPKAVFEKDASLDPATFWRRIAAIGYDAMLIIAIWFVTTMIYLLVKAAIIGLDSMKLIADAERPTSDFLLTLSLISVTFLFFSYFWQKLGQTLGMQVWRIRIQNIDGSGISWPQSLLRFSGAIVSAMTFGIGYLWMLWDKDKMTWHDKLSDSRVVFLPPPKKIEKKKRQKKD